MNALLLVSWPVGLVLAYVSLMSLKIIVKCWGTMFILEEQKVDREFYPNPERMGDYFSDLYQLQKKEIAKCISNAIGAVLLIIYSLVLAF